MKSWNLTLRRWFFSSVLILACGLILGLDLILVQPAEAVVPELRRAYEEGTEGDPGDGVLSPDNLRGADGVGSIYVGRVIRPLPQLLPVGAVILPEGYVVHPLMPVGAPFYPLWSAGSARMNGYGSWISSRFRLPNGDASYVLDEGGWHNAP